MSIDDLKSRINIIELAKSGGLKLKKQSNRLYKTTCCFHSEKKASLTFYTDTNTFKCYGCGEWGDAINFYAKRQYPSLKKEEANKKAVKELAGSFAVNAPVWRQQADNDVSGLQGGEISVREQLGGKKGQFRQDPNNVYRALKEFCGKLDQESRAYLTSESRGLTDKTIKQFHIFSITDYKKVREFLLSKFSLESLQELVLFDRINRFSFTKYRIIIPVLEDGKITALRGRFFDKGITDPELLNARYHYPKYKSTAGVAEKLFNADILKTLKKGERVYLAEGEFDTMVLQQHGHNAVGVLGVSNYNDKMIGRLNDFDLVIAFDNDLRGRPEALKISDIFYKQTGREVIREKLPEGIKDITELFIFKAKQNENIQS